MKIQFRKLTTGLLALSMAAGMLCMPAGAAVRNVTAQKSAVESGTAEAPVSSESLITESTDSHTPVDLSGATWKKVGSNLRLQSSNGKYKTGFVTQNGRLYYFDAKGNMKLGFFTVGGKKYYASYVKGEKGKGEILTGIVKVSGYYYYFSFSSSPKGAAATGFQKVIWALFSPVCRKSATPTTSSTQTASFWGKSQLPWTNPKLPTNTRT